MTENPVPLRIVDQARQARRIHFDSVRTWDRQVALADQFLQALHEIGWFQRPEAVSAEREDWEAGRSFARRMGALHAFDGQRELRRRVPSLYTAIAVQSAALGFARAFHLGCQLPLCGLLVEGFSQTRRMAEYAFHLVMLAKIGLEGGPPPGSGEEYLKTATDAKGLARRWNDQLGQLGSETPPKKASEGERLLGTIRNGEGGYCHLGAHANPTGGLFGIGPSFMESGGRRTYFALFDSTSGGDGHYLPVHVEAAIDAVGAVVDVHPGLGAVAWREREPALRKEAAELRELARQAMAQMRPPSGS